MKSNKRQQNNQMRSLMDRMDVFDDDDHFDPFGHFFNDMPRLGSGFSDFFNFGHNSLGMAERDNHMEHHFKSMKGNMPGTVISKSYVSSVKYNDNGEPERETYQSQSVNQMNEDGHSMKEKQEAYQNSVSGVEKASRQRMMDGKGHKCIKERNKTTGDQNEHNIYQGMEENDLEAFDNNYNDYRQKIGFQKNYDMLKAMKNNPRQLGGGNDNRNNKKRHMIGNEKNMKI